MWVPKDHLYRNLIRLLGSKLKLEYFDLSNRTAQMHNKETIDFAIEQIHKIQTQEVKRDVIHTHFFKDVVNKTNIKYLKDIIARIDKDGNCNFV